MYHVVGRGRSTHHEQAEVFDQSTMRSYNLIPRILGCFLQAHPHAVRAKHVYKNDAELVQPLSKQTPLASTMVPWEILRVQAPAGLIIRIKFARTSAKLCTRVYYWSPNPDILQHILN